MDGQARKRMEVAKGGHGPPILSKSNPQSY